MCSAGVLLFLLSSGFRAGINGVGTGIYHLLRQAKRRYSVPVDRICREAAHKALIGCGTCQVERRRTNWLCFFWYGVCSLYIRMRQPRGSAPKGGDDVMAVEIRFSPVARTCPGPGNRSLI